MTRTNNQEPMKGIHILILTPVCTIMVIVTNQTPFLICWLLAIRISYQIKLNHTETVKTEFNPD